MKKLPLPAKIALVPALLIIGVVAVHALGQKPRQMKSDTSFVLQISEHKASLTKFSNAIKHAKSFDGSYDGKRVKSAEDLARLVVTSETRAPEPSPSASIVPGGTNITQSASFSKAADLELFAAALK